MDDTPNPSPTESSQRDGQAPAETPRPSGDRRLLDHLANERTLQAWTRTSIAVIGLGFIVARFGFLVRALAGRSATAGILTAAGVIGVALTLFGAAITALSLARYLQIRRDIERGEPRVESGLGIALATGLTLTGLVLAIYLALAQ
jgi:putative membrane protein